MTKKVQVVELVHHATDDGGTARTMDFDAEEITEILLSFGAPPSVAPAAANAVIEWLIKVHQEAGAKRMQ